jgi:hypothetical protein
MRTRLLAVPFALVLLAGCTAPAAPVGGGDVDPDPTTAPVSQPAWYGTDLDVDNCPVPAAGVALEIVDADGFIQVGAPADWCVYTSTEYTQYYVLPVESGTDFGSEVRNVLEPAGWEFDAADDDSPQWSFVTAYPAGAETDFADGAVDGSIFTVSSATTDDIDTYRIWFSDLPTAFGGDWAEGDEISVLGFW